MNRLLPQYSWMMRARRRQLGFSIREACLRAGITRAKWRQCEAGTYDPLAYECFRISRAIGLTVDELLNDEATAPD